LKNNLTLAAAPAQLPVDLNTFKIHARVRIDDETEDEYLNGLIAAATESIDGANGWLGRALITQQWKLTLHAFPGTGKIMLPLPPLQGVDSVKYIDAAGAEQTFAAENYEVVTAAEQGYLRLLSGKAWPQAKSCEPVSVLFKCGYGGDPAAVPFRIRQYIMVQAADMYNNREANLVGTNIAPVPGVDTMLNDFRWRDESDACGTA